jgi:pentose-5-phosphate-3-epimerase
MENMMDKVRTTRKMIGDRPIWLQVDGGISMHTIEMALEAGADTFVVGSAVSVLQILRRWLSLLENSQRAFSGSSKLIP